MISLYISPYYSLKEGDLVYVTLRVNNNYLLYARLATDPVIESISIKATRTDWP